MSKVEIPAHWVDQQAAGGPPPKGHLAAVAALVDVLFETTSGAPLPERVAWTCERIRVSFEGASLGARRLFRVMLWAVCTISPLLVFRPWPLRWMSHETRAKAVGRFERSPFALSLFGLKALLAIQYFEHPEAAREAGFDGQPKITSSTGAL